MFWMELIEKSTNESVILKYVANISYSNQCQKKILVQLHAIFKRMLIDFRSPSSHIARQ